jgi:NAD(P)-dependent dehydrogenase (short-subunit alcohol dehydrogenase family)
MKQVVMITGAGTGIGALASRTLAHAGHSVCATMRAPDGRNAERATALRDAGAGAAGELRVIELDVLSEQSAVAAASRVVDEQGRIDVIVHNAAHLFFGFTEAFTPEQVIDAYNTNTVGALRVNRVVLPVMRRQGAGLLLWVGSGTTRAIPPFLGPYAAAKAAFDAFAESTAWDVEALGIETTILHAGVFTSGTEHFAAAAFAADGDRVAQYDGTPASQRLASSAEDTERLFAPGTTGDPQIVADEILRIVDLEPRTRPRRTAADSSDYGAEIINGAAEELRLRLARRMQLTDLLAGEQRAIPRAASAR